MCLSLMVLASHFDGGSNIISVHSGVDQFTISILREEGVLIPFAKYRNRIWHAPWPKPGGYGDDVNNTLADLSRAWFERSKDPLTTWYYWNTDDAPTVLKTSKIVKVENHCQTNWGLVSDFSGKALKANEHHRNIGVALNVKKKVDNSLELANTAKDFKNVHSFIQPTFEKMESLKVSELIAISQLSVYPPKGERRTVGLSLSKLYKSRFAINGQYYYYFEAKKEYKKKASANDPYCNNISFFKGWILQNHRGDLMFVDAQLSLTDCDTKGIEITKLLGSLTIKDRIYVITEDHGYEDESYSILEINGARINRVIKVYGGSC